MKHTTRLLLAAACCSSLVPIASAQQVSAPALLQFFESTSLNTQKRAADMFMTGYGQIWVPPTGRADINDYSVGYDQYDRFDLGTADHPTLYGTENTLKSAIVELRRAGLSTYVDLTWNHNGFQDYRDPNFVASGGYPGFVAGDFHNPALTSDQDQYNGRVSNLLDIAQESNNQYIRQPVGTDNRNIPAGTTTVNGRLANVPTEANRRFYQDRSRPADRYINGQPIWDFTADTDKTGDPVTENATGYLMRQAQWMVQAIGVDGFRLDATKHYPTWVLNQYFDLAVSGANRRLNLDGTVKQVFSFGEAYDSNKAFLQTYINKSTDGNLVHNRDTLDFPLFDALKGNLSSNGLNNSWYNVVNSSIDSQDDGNANNGSQGVAFVQSHDTGGPDLSNVAYAYTLMRPGNTIVYMNAKGFQATLGNRDFPQDGRGDALGGQYGDTITKLVDLRNTHGRGDYIERDLEKETLIYERDRSAVVGLSNRSDNGYDTRTVQTNFAAGTRLLEMTGNATDASVDPTGAIADYVVVDSSGKITIAVPRNHNVNGVAHNKGYVVYGLPTPNGTLSIPDRASTVGGQTQAAITNGTTRVASLDVVNGNSFTISLNTSAPAIGGYTDTQAGGNNAVFSINGGVKPDGSANDLNGNGHVDYTDSTNTLVYGFEEFTTKKSPLVGGGDGQYRQTIDATKLVEGFNYLDVRAFRARTDGGPAVYSDFKKVIYVDRLPAQSDVTSVANVGGNDRALRITNADATADNVHAFLDLSGSLTDAQILAQANGNSQSTQTDTTLWNKTFGNVGSGNHTITLVTYEPSGRSVIKRYTGYAINTGRGLGLGDTNFDNTYSASDTSTFETALYARGTQFNAAGDLNADGVIDNRDLLALPARFATAGANAGTIAAAKSAIIRRGNVNGDSITSSADIDFLQTQLGTTAATGDLWLYDLNVDGAVTSADVSSLVTDYLFTRFGDTNLDRQVDFTDLVTLAQNYNQNVSAWAKGDFNGDGKVAFADLVLLAQNYGFSSTASLVTNGAADALAAGGASFAADWAMAQAFVPEPGSLLSLGLLTVALRRRRGR